MPRCQTHFLHCLSPTFFYSPPQHQIGNLPRRHHAKSERRQSLSRHLQKIAERYEANQIYFNNDFRPTPIDVSRPEKSTGKPSPATSMLLTSQKPSPWVTARTGSTAFWMPSNCNLIHGKPRSQRIVCPTSISYRSISPSSRASTQTHIPTAYGMPKTKPGIRQRKRNLEIRYQELEKSLNDTTAQLQQKKNNLTH